MSNKQAAQADAQPERKPYNFANAKATSKAKMVEATPLSGYNGDIVSLCGNDGVMKVGDAFEGTLRAIETRGVDQDGKDRIVYVFADAKGEEFGVWGRGGLNLMNRVPIGTLVRVTYSAYDPKAVRPTPQHQFKIELEEGKRLLPIGQGFIPPSQREAEGPRH